MVEKIFWCSPVTKADPLSGIEVIREDFNFFFAWTVRTKKHLCINHLLSHIMVAAVSIRHTSSILILFCKLSTCQHPVKTWTADHNSLVLPWCQVEKTLNYKIFCKIWIVIGLFLFSVHCSCKLKKKKVRINQKFTISIFSIYFEQLFLKVGLLIANLFLT